MPSITFHDRSWELGVDRYGFTVAVMHHVDIAFLLLFIHNNLMITDEKEKCRTSISVDGERKIIENFKKNV